MGDIIAGLIVLLIVGGAVFYIIREKKQGTKCIGCCQSSSCGEGCSCNNEKNEAQD